MCDIVYFMTQGEAGERIALACPKKLGFHFDDGSSKQRKKSSLVPQLYLQSFFPLVEFIAGKKSFLHEISHIVRY